MAVFNNTSEVHTKSKNRLKKKPGLDEKTDLALFMSPNTTKANLMRRAEVSLWMFELEKK